MSIKRILYVLTNEISSDKKKLSLLLALSAGQDSTCLAFFIIMYQSYSIVKTNSSRYYLLST